MGFLNLSLRGGRREEEEEVIELNADMLTLAPIGPSPPADATVMLRCEGRLSMSRPNATAGLLSAAVDDPVIRFMLVLFPNL